MTSELVVDVQPKEISIALLEDKNLVEFQKEERNLSFSVGNMYVGKVRKLMPGLNACFVDVGFEKDAFLHYLDLGPQFLSFQKYLKQVISDRKKLYPMAKASMLPDIEKDGSIQNPRIARGIHPALDSVALEVISQLPKFQPAKSRGEPIAVNFTLPVTFTLEMLEKAKLQEESSKP